MNEVFTAVDMVNLVAGIIMIVVGLLSVYLIFVGYRFAMEALDDVYGLGGLKPGWHEDIQGPYVDLELGVGRLGHDQDTGILHMDVQGPNGGGYYESYNDKTDTFSR